jgi:hypothetical protein
MGHPRRVKALPQRAQRSAEIREKKVEKETLDPPSKNEDGAPVKSKGFTTVGTEGCGDNGEESGEGNPRPTLKKRGWGTREEQRLYHSGHRGVRR